MRIVVHYPANLNFELLYFVLYHCPYKFKINLAIVVY